MNVQKAMTVKPSTQQALYHEDPEKEEGGDAPGRKRAVAMALEVAKALHHSPFQGQERGQWQLWQ